MTREELIAYIKENDTHYFNFTFIGYSFNDLLQLKQKIEEEKRKEIQQNPFLSKLFR